MIAEALAGLLGGAGQGLQNVQDNRQQQARMAIQKQQADLQMQEAKRRAVMEAYQTMQPGQEVDPAQASEFKAMGLGGLEAVGGKIIKAKSPQDQLMELKYKEAEEEANQRTRKTALLDKIHNAGSGFFELPPQARQAEWASAGLNGDDWMTPEEKLKFSPQFQSANVNAQARIATDNGPAPRSPYEGARFQMDARKAARAAADSAAKNPITGQIDKALWQSTYESELQQAGIGQQQPAQASPQGLAPGTRGVVGGVPAVWDGRGWKRQ